MKLIGLDPSFTGFGIAIKDTETGEIRSTRVKSDFPVYKSFPSLLKGSNDVTDKVIKFISDVEGPIVFVVEYPAMATKAGAYLATMQGILFSKINHISQDIIYLPPTAVNSFTLNKSKTKTHLVNFVKDSYKDIDFKRLSHDEATAIILISIYENVLKGKYKNKWFIYKED